MKYWALTLYPMMAAIIYVIWRKLRGRSIEEIVEDSAHEHRALLDVAANHPEGGTAKQYSDWLSEVDSRRD